MSTIQTNSSSNPVPPVYNQPVHVFTENPPEFVTCSKLRKNGFVMIQGILVK